MDDLIAHVLSFFLINFPSWPAILIEGPISLAWASLCLLSAGALKRYKGYPTGYTRKIFHFLIFGSVAVIQFIFDTSIVCLFGGMTTLVVFYAVSRGSGNILYEAMAREKDDPHASLYIVIPYFATLLGGLISNIAFGSLAIIGYLVTGLGDAVGEPVGTKFGRHTYRTPSLTAVKSVRSIEGSLGVFCASLLAIVAGIALVPGLYFDTSCLLTVPLLAIASTGIEAVSPHGWDNLTMQVGPVLMAAVLL